MVKSRGASWFVAMVWASATVVAGSASADPAPATVSGLEAPLRTNSAPLPDEGAITCSYFPDLTVRVQTLTSESNPEVHVLKTRDAPCKPGEAAGGTNLAAGQALVGRKGRLYVFADATGVEVYDLAAKRVIHRGETFGDTDGLPSDPKAMVVTGEGDGLRLVYRQDVYESCSMMTDRSCWGKLAKLAGLPADLAKQPPNCAAAYKRPNAQPDFTTAIGVRREVTITAAGKVSIAVSGPVGCRAL